MPWVTSVHYGCVYLAPGNWRAHLEEYLQCRQSIEDGRHFVQAVYTAKLRLRGQAELRSVKFGGLQHNIVNGLEEATAMADAEREQMLEATDLDNLHEITKSFTKANGKRKVGTSGLLPHVRQRDGKYFTEFVQKISMPGEPHSFATPLRCTETLAAEDFSSLERAEALGPDALAEVKSAIVAERVAGKATLVDGEKLPSGILYHKLRSTVFAQFLNTRGVQRGTVPAAVADLTALKHVFAQTMVALAAQPKSASRRGSKVRRQRWVHRKRDGSYYLRIQHLSTAPRDTLAAAISDRGRIVSDLRGLVATLRVR